MLIPKIHPTPNIINKYKGNNNLSDINTLGVNSPNYKQMVDDIMNEIGADVRVIDEFKNKPFSTLSGGQRQKVLLARALCASSGVLLLDEPLNSLDPVATAGFFEILDDLKAQGYTLIMISHDIHCAIKYADKILHLSKDDVFYGPSSDYPNSHLGKHMLKEGHHHND